jgi:hypothetical protein
MRKRWIIAAYLNGMEHLAPLGESRGWLVITPQCLIPYNRGVGKRTYTYTATVEGKL